MFTLTLIAAVWLPLRYIKGSVDEFVSKTKVKDERVSTSMRKPEILDICRLLCHYSPVFLRVRLLGV